MKNGAECPWSRKAPVTTLSEESPYDGVKDNGHKEQPDIATTTTRVAAPEKEFPLIELTLIIV